MGKKHVLVIGPDGIPSFTIGILQPLSYLKSRGVCRFSVKSDHEVSADMLAAADFVVFFRSTRAEAYRHLETANSLGKRTIYVIDDHFLAMPVTTETGRAMQDTEVRRVCVKFLKNASVVKVASEFFARHLKVHFEPKSVVCFPGSVDFSILERVERRKSDGPVVIGYAGGRKEAAFAPVIRALQKVKDTFGDGVRFEFYGFEPPGASRLPGVKHHKYIADYRKFLRELYRAGWDIGLAPLESALYHDCKTNNKYREYAACRIPGVYSDSPAYRDWVKPEQTGLLVDNTVDGWYEGIARLVEDAALRRRIREQAEREAREQFSVETCAKRWQELLLHD